LYNIIATGKGTKRKSIVDKTQHRKLRFSNSKPAKNRVLPHVLWKCK